MKLILSLSLIFLLILFTTLAFLVLFGTFNISEALEYSIKPLIAILILAGIGVVFAILTNINKNNNIDI